MGVSGVWSYGGYVEGGIAKHVTMSNWRVVTVPDSPLCCGMCYVVTIVSLEAKHITVRSSFGPTSGVWLWQWQVVYVDLDAESRGTAAGGISDCSQWSMRSIPWGLGAPRTCCRGSWNGGSGLWWTAF